MISFIDNRLQKMILVTLTFVDIGYVDICIVDGGLLLQPLANQAQSASARSKPDLVVKVAGKFYCC
jgi:hypothetical protein